MSHYEVRNVQTSTVGCDVELQPLHMYSCSCTCSQLVPSPTPNFSSLAVRIASDEKLGDVGVGLGTRLLHMHNCAWERPGYMCSVLTCTVAAAYLYVGLFLLQPQRVMAHIVHKFERRLRYVGICV